MKFRINFAQKRKIIAFLGTNLRFSEAFLFS